MNDEITARAGREFYTFDGRIIEVFGSYPKRFHVRNTELRVSGPDRKGRRTVVVVAGLPEAPATEHTWTLSAEEWQQAQGGWKPCWKRCGRVSRRPGIRE